MKRSHSWMILALVLIFSIPLVSYIQSITTMRSTSDELDDSCSILLLSTKWVENITVIINITDEGISTFHDITLEDDITAFNATIAAVGIDNIDYYTTVSGVYVKGIRINDTWYSSGTYRFWLYWVDEIFGGISCSKYDTSNNSVVIWKYTGQNPWAGDTTAAEFWFYVALFGGIAVACGLGIYFIIKRGV